MDDSTYIRRLRERLRHDSGSRLMLSFAEELRRRDKMEDAIAFLVDGIKKNPDYHAARLTLGRWYLSVEMLPEAKREFIAVIEKAPLNIHAHKGLAEVYKRAGDADGAASEYKKVLELSPSDIDAVSYLETHGAEVRKAGSAEDEHLEVQGLQIAEVPEGTELIEQQETVLSRSSNDEVLSRLNIFLEAVKTGFSNMPLSDPGTGTKNRIIDRLDTFLKAIKSGFAPGPQDAGSAVTRLNSFLDAIKIRFSGDLQKDTGSF